MGAAGREIGLHFALNALYLEVGGDAKAYAEAAVDLLKEDASACRDLVTLFERYAKEGRATEKRALQWASKYREKAERIEAYLKEITDP